MYGTKLIRRVYGSSPALLRDAMATLYGMKEARERYGTFYREKKKFLQKTQRWSMQEKLDYQKLVLDEFVRKAIATVPFYRNQEAYRQSSPIAALPILSKETVRAHMAEFYALNGTTGPVRWVQTSGTTGKPMSFPISNGSFQFEHAIRSWHYSLAGVDTDERPRAAFCAGHPVTSAETTTPPFWVHDRHNNWLLLSSYHLAPRYFAAYVKELDAFGPITLAGYPSSLYLLALAYQAHGSGSLSLRAIFTSSETLQPGQREVIERVFRAKVFDYYGNTEMCAKILECPSGRLHILHEFSYVEVVDAQGNAVAPGCGGRLICTSFSNAAFPLVRYDVGDTVTLSRETGCPCGMAGVLLDSIDGRVEDYVVTPDGRMIGRLDHILKGNLPVREAQIEQTALDSLVIRIVRSAGYGEKDERAILEETRIRVGSSIRIRCEYVDAIPRLPNGKLKFVISRVGTHDATAFGQQ
jgi:phenylacetate-CoA ligase